MVADNPLCPPPPRPGSKPARIKYVVKLNGKELYAQIRVASFFNRINVDLIKRGYATQLPRETAQAVASVLSYMHPHLRFMIEEAQ